MARMRMRKLLFFLLSLFLLVPSLFLTLSAPLSGPLASTSTPPQQSERGGAYGAVSYAAPTGVAPTATPSATATPPVTQPTMYGGSGKDGACLGTSGTGNDMIKMDFGWPASVLNKQWKHYASYRLCNDRYTWETVITLPIKTVLQTLQWPPDLLLPQYANQVVTLQPLSSFDPVTQQAQQQAQQGNQQTSTETNKNCIWHISFSFINGDIDICQPIRAIVSAGSSGIRWIYQNTQAQIDFMWQTPLQPFQDDKTSGLLTVWSMSWAIVLACITAVLAYGALRYMVGSAVNWLAYANLAELLPRLLFGLLAAYFSKEFFIMLIQANNALAGIFNHNTINTIINGKASGVVNEALQILYGLMGFCLIVEEVARIAILYLLFAFAPILFFFASLRETQRWAKTAGVAAVVFVFIQAAQSATLDVGGRVLTTVLKNTDGNLTFLNILISLAILYLTLMLFFSLARLALGGGIFPYADGAFGLSRRVLPFAAGTAIGAVAAAAGQFRLARRNMFPLPPRNPPSGGTSSGSGGSGGPAASGGSGGPAASGGSGSAGQTPVTVGAKPFVHSGNTSGSSSSPANGKGKQPGGPAGSGGTKPGGAGTSGTKLASPAVARPVQATTGGAPSPGASRVSRPAGRPAGSSSASQPGQWQKTPPQTQRRRLTEEEFLDWMNQQDEH